MDPWYKVVTPRKEVREGRSFNPDEFATGQIEQRVFDLVNAGRARRGLPPYLITWNCPPSPGPTARTCFGIAFSPTPTPKKKTLPPESRPASPACSTASARTS